MSNWIRRQQTVIILICVIIICICLPVLLYAKANLPELVKRNLNDSLMPATEMKELGDDFIGAREDHAYILRQYLGHMKKRNGSLLLRLLYPKLSPRKQLTSALAKLNLNEKEVQQDQAKNYINEAKEIVRQFTLKSQKFSDIQISTFEPEDLPEELLIDAKSALDDSRECVKTYGNDPNMLNAQRACRKNRIAIALAYLVRCGYQDFNSLDDELKQFQGDINRTIYYNDTLQGNTETPENDKKLLVGYTNSELRRLDVLQAIRDKDTPRAYKLLRKTIEVSSKISSQE